MGYSKSSIQELTISCLSYHSAKTVELLHLIYWSAKTSISAVLSTEGASLLSVEW